MSQTDPFPPGHAEEPPWDHLDPGIAAVVRALWSAGFRTIDSGDGRAKGALGWDLDAYSDVPHVVIRPEPGKLEETGHMLLRWVAEQGLPADTGEADGVSVDAFFYADDDGRPGSVLLIGGEQLYGWTPAGRFDGIGAALPADA